MAAGYVSMLCCESLCCKIEFKASSRLRLHASLLSCLLVDSHITMPCRFPHEPDQVTSVMGW